MSDHSPAQPGEQQNSGGQEQPRPPYPASQPEAGSVQRPGPWPGAQQPFQQPYPQGSYQPGPQGWQPNYPPVAPPQRKPRGRGCLYGFLGALAGVIVLIVAVVAIGISAGNSGSTGSASGPGTTGAGNNPAPVARLGDKVRDGKFQFTITRITHRSRVGPAGFGEKAQGRYTILYVTVTNIGNQSQTLDDGAQLVFDAAGRQFSADTAADIDLNSTGDSVFLNDINPGNTVHGKIAFDIPKGDHAVRAELHDSEFSGGVTVRLA